MGHCNAGNALPFGDCSFYLWENRAENMHVRAYLCPCTRTLCYVCARRRVWCAHLCHVASRTGYPAVRSSESCRMCRLLAHSTWPVPSAL